MAKKKIAPRAQDAAGVGPYARERERLVPLGSLRNWKVVDGEVDIRSWDVRTVSGRVLGSVRELLVDPKAGEVVMLDVDLPGTSEHAYVPARIVEIDRVRRIVRADSADLERAGAEPLDSRSDAVPVKDLADRGSVRYANGSAERVIERRPIVEETVVRRREVDESDERP